MVEGTLHNMVILHNKGILHNKVVIHQLGTLHNKVILLVVTLHNKGTHLLVILVHLVIMLQGLMEGLMDTAAWEQCLLGVQLLLPLLMVLTISPTAPMVLRAIIHRVAIHKVATLMAAMHMVVVTWVMENSSSMASSKWKAWQVQAWKVWQARWRQAWIQEVEVMNVYAIMTLYTAA
jgi:hypothetical protein